MTTVTKEIAKQKDFLKTEAGDWISIPIKSGGRRIGLVIEKDNSPAEEIREVAFRERDGRISISCYWIDRTKSSINNISYATYCKTDAEFGRYDTKLQEAEAQ